MKTRYNKGITPTSNETFEFETEAKKQRRLRKKRKDRFRVKNSKPHQWIDDEPLEWDIEKDWK